MGGVKAPLVSPAPKGLSGFWPLFMGPLSNQPLCQGSFGRPPQAENLSGRIAARCTQ
jgi:hypothetical protein